MWDLRIRERRILVTYQTVTRAPQPSLLQPPRSGRKALASPLVDAELILRCDYVPEAVTAALVPPLSDGLPGGCGSLARTVPVAARFGFSIVGVPPDAQAATKTAGLPQRWHQAFRGAPAPPVAPSQ